MQREMYPHGVPTERTGVGTLVSSSEPELLQMFSGAGMRIKVIRDEVDRLALEHGASASEFVLKNLKAAKQRKNMRLELFLKQVALEMQRWPLKRVPTEAAA